MVFTVASNKLSIHNTALPLFYANSCLQCSRRGKMILKLRIEDSIDYIQSNRFFEDM